MKKSLYIFLFISASSIAANQDTHSTYVNQISVWGHNGDVLVQMSPRHNIEGLSCTDDYWLRLSKNDEGFETMLSLLLASQMAKKAISVRSEDDSAGAQPYCRLQRVITYQ